ncbi:glycosyltransferase family 39 protein [candidate division KSB1 bacterium]|nr:glycosyltransferase family 39 protein [candidate division KSB1 bacterium]
MQFFSKISPDKYIFAILGLAFALRFVGIWYGLPSLYNSDEPTIVSQALSFGTRKSLEPTFLQYPTLYFYFLFFIYGIYFGIGFVLGIFNSILDFGASFFLDPGGLFLVGRFLSVVLGTFSVWVIFRLGQRFFSKNVALISSLILAVSFIHVSRSHWILVEAGLGLMCAWALYLILKYYEKPTIKANVFAGLVCGLAISTKYNAGFILIPLLLSSIFIYKKNVPKLFKNLCLSVVTLVSGFLLGSPYWIFSFSSFFDSTFKYTFSHVTHGVVGHITDIPFVWPFWELVSNDWTLGFLLIAGFVYVLFTKEKKQILLVSFALPTFLYVGSWSSADVHYLIPIFPALVLLAAVFLNDILRSIRNRNLKILFVILLFGLPFAKILYYDFVLTQKDTRAFAEDWFESNVAAGSVIGYENYVYGPNLFDPARFFKNKAHSQFLPLELRERLVEASLRRKTYNLFNFRKDVKRAGLSENIKFKNPYFRELLLNRLPKLSTLKKQGVEFIIASSDTYQHYFKKRPPKKGTPVWLSFQNGRAFYQSIFTSDELVLVKEFQPEFPNLGPTIKIYKFKVE